MFIIYGTRGITSHVKAGTFHCPCCGPNRPYQHKRVNGWFTLYFIPVIPLGKRGEYVECRQCAGTFGTEALIPIGPSFGTDMLDQIQRLFVLAAVSRGKPSAKTTQAVQYCYRMVANQQPDEHVLHYEYELAQQADTTMATFARKVSHVVEPALRPKVLAGVHLILKSQDGGGADSARQLRDIGEALEMSPQQLEATLNSIKKAS